ncbi:MAG TPA: ectonucleotide pyrophosphatase/phosphodiesterase [Pseudomonadales bacterium]|nr:ectonucleotide pyrophosphatase/phosphodiesterase [Pseudomonadales bacterium]
MKHLHLWIGLLAVASLVACEGTTTGGTTHPAAATEDAVARTTLVASGGRNASQWLTTDPVVLISFDGFRHDYIDRFRPPNFMRVIDAGVRASAMQPPFPSKTFPSHYTIATGLWAEHHGITGNHFLDPERGAAYDMRDPVAVRDGSWYRGEPIWVTAESQGMVAASYFFVGTEADIQGIRPSHTYAYDGSVPGPARVDQALAWLAMAPERRPRIITLYFSDVDSAGHRHGPDSREVAAAVMRVDGWLGRLLDGIDALPEGDRVSLVLVSDHGMYRYDEADMHAVDLATLADVTWVDGGPYASLMIDGDDPARHRAIRDAIAAQVPPAVGVYLRADVPARLHYSADRRAGDIVVVPPLGHTVYEAGRLPDTGGFTHGWDPAAPEMHGIFAASGPRLEAGATIGRIDHVDVYPLLAELLGLRPAEVDGSLAPFAAALRPRAGDQQAATAP